MPPNPPSTSQSFGRTFIVAAAVLGIVALAQLSAVTIALFTKKSALTATAADDEKPHQPALKIDVNNLPGPETPDEGLNVTGDPIADAKPAQPLPGENPK